MDIVVNQVGQVSLISVVGSVDALSSPDVEACLQSQLDSGQAQLVLDLSEVDFMSSAGLRVILLIVHKSREVGGDLRLAAAQPGVEGVLSLVGITQILQVFGTVEEAVASFG
jgi:stage II sporulation protein AA (anti-sigma F factor antagonist)